MNARRRWNRLPLRARGSQPRSHRARLGRRRAFTLVELVVVMAILLMAAVAIMPSYLRFIHGRQLDEAAHRTVALAAEARGLAVARDATVSLVFDPGGPSVSLRVDPAEGEGDREGAVPGPAPVMERLSSAGGPVHYPGDVMVSFIRNDPSQGPVIRFYGDGRADEAQMRIAIQGFEPIVLLVNGRTGRMTVGSKQDVILNP